MIDTVDRRIFRTMAEMVLSFSRPDPSSPSAVAGASFSTTRRGFDQNEVRDFLRMVSAEMARLQERVVFLEREMRETKNARPLVHAEMSEATIAELLGEETARIIEAAREAAHKIKERSEDAASRIIREASEEAARIREETELECSRRRQDATSDAEAEVLMAKQQGREMVNEARSYRERVLADVARRRELAREQLQDLHHGRERIVHAFERARHATEDVLRDLLEPADEPMEFVNLAPTTGPVPVIVQADDIERLEAVRSPSSAPEFSDDPESVAFEDSPHQEVDLHSETHSETMSEIEATEISLADLEGPEDSELRDIESGESLESLESTDLSDSLETVDDAGNSHDDVDSVSNVVPLFARGERSTDQRPTEPVIEQPHRERAVVDAGDIFERLRRSSTQSVAADASRQIERPASSEEEPVVSFADDQVDDGECFAKRNETLIPVIVAMSRMVKRVLADEQNQVLDILRGKPVVRHLDALVGSVAEHGGRYVASLNNLLGEAALAGARSLSDEPESELVKSIESQMPAVRDFVVSTLVEPLRERLERSIGQSSDSNAELATIVRVVYREWKNQFIDEHMDDVALMAFGRGAAAMLNPSMRVCWKVDPDGPPCADAEDNSLGGFVRGGEEFPTGHSHAPAHSGCRCVLVSDHN